jgi:hypothetical protein
MTLRPTVFDRHVLTFDVTGFAQSLAERGQRRCKRAGRGGAEETDHRHRLLLRAHSERTKGGSTAEKDNELAPFHSITS